MDSFNSLPRNLSAARFLFRSSLFGRSFTVDPSYISVHPPDSRRPPDSSIFDQQASNESTWFFLCSCRFGCLLDRSSSIERSLLLQLLRLTNPIARCDPSISMGLSTRFFFFDRPETFRRSSRRSRRSSVDSIDNIRSTSLID